ncbi:MAG: TonB-dependent receptor [Gammaproteobacteria bacterium]
MLHSTFVLTLCATCIAASSVPRAAAADGEDGGTQVPSNAATAHELPQIVVIGNTPLSGLGLPLSHVPSNVQTAGSKDMKRQQSLDLSDYLNGNFSGISVSQSADNPFQSDVNYHGFTASPLLGTPQGLSVYVDGVRVNESFGDTVNWDLIPESAISTVTLMSGSNPVFGLNTLGGALAIQTKSGHDNPGTEIEASGGSFGRRAFEAETGGEFGNFDYFLTGNYFDEDGWRDLSPTHLYQAFGKAGWQNDKSDVDLSYTYADTSMIGNGTTPESMLVFRRESIFSAPDFTHNIMNFVNVNGTQFLNDHLLLSGNAYFRQLITASNNGDVNDNNYLSADYSGPPIDCSLPPTSLADNAYCSNGINRASRLTQRTTGAGVQLTESHELFGAKNQAVLGVNFDRSTDRYSQSFQYATLTPERTAIANANPFNPADTVNSLSGGNKILGVYLTDTYSPNELLHFTAAARYNRNTETLNGFSVNTDLGDFGDGFAAAEPLFEDHTYTRVNPSFGFTLTPNDELTLYADYNEASRAPTVIELGCSDPENPCGLPNEFASDPNLEQVVARTMEMGARGSTEDKTLNWSVDVFHTVNSNDIQFIATTTSEGYFNNVGKTRRQGADFAVGGTIAELSWRVVYSFVDATYQSNFEVNGASNSSADEDGNIMVRAGDRIPLIPRHTGRLVLDYALATSWDVGANVIVSSGVFLHGNENNANQAGGTNGAGDAVAGSGRVSGYAVLNLHSTYHIGKSTDLFIRLANAFDKHYATAGFLTSTSFDRNGSFRADPDDWTNENAISPAQPRAVWVGMRYRWE